MALEEALRTGAQPGSPSLQGEGTPAEAAENSHSPFGGGLPGRKVIISSIHQEEPSTG